MNNSKNNNKRFQKKKLLSGLGIECETSLVFKNTISMTGSDIKQYYYKFLNFGKITEVDKIYYDNILETQDYDVLRVVDINPFFRYSEFHPDNEFLPNAKFSDFQFDKSIIQLCKNLAKLMKYESSEVAFNKTKETVGYENTNQSPNSPSMIEIMTLNWENTPVNDIIKELNLKKKLVLKLIRADTTIKKLEKNYGEVIYPKNGAERLMLFTKDNEKKLITDYLGSYHINLTLPYTFDTESYQDIKTLYEIMNTQEEKGESIVRYVSEYWNNENEIFAFELIFDYLEQISVPLIQILQKQRKIRQVIEKENKDINFKKLSSSLNKLIKSPHVLAKNKNEAQDIIREITDKNNWKQIWFLIDIMLGDFQNIHKLLGIYLQYLSPILLTNYSTPDVASFKDNNMFTEMSFRLISSKYSYINSSNIKEKGFPLERKATKTDFKIADIYKQLKYRKLENSNVSDTFSVPEYEFGHDFRRDPVKGIFGFEFRVLDLFPTKYMKEVLTFIYCLADHIKKTIKDYKNKILTIKNPYNNKVISNMIKKLFLEGWNTLITEDYYNIVCKELDLKLPDWHQYLTANEMLDSVYQFIRNKNRNIGFFSAQVNPEGYKIESLTKYNRKLFNLMITKYLKRHRNDKDKKTKDTEIKKLEKLFSLFKENNYIGDFIKKSKLILPENEHEEIIDIYFYFKDGTIPYEGVLIGGKGGKKVRKHQGIIQTGGNIGRLRKGYRYSGKKLKSGLSQIIKCKSKKC